MANTLQVKYSEHTPEPPALLPGELAWSTASRRLFIGDADGSRDVIAQHPVVERLQTQLNALRHQLEALG